MRYVFWLCISIIILGLFLEAREARAEISDKDAVKAIMGEARGESFRGKIAVAEAIRNRGTLKGVYGHKAQFKESQLVWDEAKIAWETSRTTSITKGANHWENVEEFGEPYWAKSCKKTVEIESHQFYRC